MILQITAERRSWHKGLPWHAQFAVGQQGWFRAWGRTPAAALALAWRRMRRGLPPEELARICW